MNTQEKKCPICGNAYTEKGGSKGKEACPDCKPIVDLADAMASYVAKANGKKFVSEGRNEEENALLKDANESLTIIHAGLLPHLKALESLYDVFNTHELTLDCPPYKVGNVPYLGLQRMHEFVYDEFLSLLKPFLDGKNGFAHAQEALEKPSSIKVYLVDENGEKETFPRFDAATELKKMSSFLEETSKILVACQKWGKDLFTFMGDRYRFKGFDQISLAKIYRTVYALDSVYRAINLSLSPEATLEFGSTDKIASSILKEAVSKMGNQEK